MAKIVVLGAGPSGLFCADELIRNKTFPLILEKESSSGGLCRTFSFNECKFDLGPHVFFTKNEYLLDNAKKLLGKDLLFQEWKVRQFIDGKLYTYPNTATDLLKKQGVIKIAEFASSNVLAKLSKPEDNFQSYLYYKLGKKFADFNVINYTEKMWGISAEMLSLDWIKPRLDRLSFANAVKQVFFPGKKKFYYPKLGNGQLYDMLAKGKDIRYNNNVEKIKWNNDEIISVTSNGKEINVKTLVSSIPLKEFLLLLDPLPDGGVFRAADKMKYRSQVFVLLTINKPQLLKEHWIYFPQKSIPFARIYEPKNFSSSLSPESKTSLLVEYFCFEDDDLWQKNDEEIYEVTLAYLLNTKLFDLDVVSDYEVIRQRNTYPMKDFESIRACDEVKQYLFRFKNLKLIGRHGTFGYDNQDEAALSGIEAAREILNKPSLMSKKVYIDV